MVAFDAAQENQTTTTDPFTFTFTPVGTIRGFALVMYTDTITDLIDGAVTYGGVALSRVDFITLNLGETGSIVWYFRGDSLPTGAQTVSISHTGAASPKIFTTFSLTGTDDLEVVDFDSQSITGTTVQLSLASGALTAIRLLAIFGEENAPGNITADGSLSAVHDHDFGVSSGKVSRQTTPGSGTPALGYTTQNLDHIISGIAVTEVVATAQDLVFEDTATQDTAEPWFMLNVPDNTLNWEQSVDGFNATEWSIALTLEANFGIASETDSGRPFTADSDLLETFGLSSETDSAMPFSADTIREALFDFAEETNEAEEFLAEAILSDLYEIAEETDSAQPFTAATEPLDLYDLASEADAAMPFTAESLEFTLYAHAGETDSAQPFTANAVEGSPVLATYNLVTETDSGRAFTAITPVLALYGRANETDTGRRFRARALNPAGDAAGASCCCYRRFFGK